MKLLRYTAILLILNLSVHAVTGQEGFTDETRALYILDISRYVQFDESVPGREEFIITILGEQLDLYWELERLAKTRKEIQGKPIRIRVTRKIQQLQPCNVVFVGKEGRFQIEDVLKKIKGTNTLLISEGYPFRSSMINFVVSAGEPKFEANEELMKQEGLHVNELFLAQAVKTREDWEALYEVTENELEKEKSITEQQNILIERQLKEINEQKRLIRENSETLLQLRDAIAEREREIEEKTKVLEQQEAEISLQKRTMVEQVNEVLRQRGILEEQEKMIGEKEKIITSREAEIRAQDEKIVLQAEAIQKQKIIIFSAIVALLLLFGLVYFVWKNYRNKKKANLLLQAQRDQIAYQKKHITDSIEYAKKIQAAILPSMELFTDELDHFVLFKPRDIVSGDFYWVEKIDEKFLVIAADCTGHGVPGAFMSMLGISFLNEIVLSKHMLQPDQILNTLRDKIIVALKQERESKIKDGMDMTVCLLDIPGRKLLFSGAHNPLYHLREGELTEIKGDKMPVSYHDVMDSFTLHEVVLKPGDTFYTSSDGYVDQFGGPLQKKFLAKNFRNLLVSIQDLSMVEQGAKLDQEFEAYRGELEQVDDVVVIGIKV